MRKYLSKMRSMVITGAVLALPIGLVACENERASRESPALSTPHTVAEIDAFRLVVNDDLGQLHYSLQCLKESTTEQRIEVILGSHAGQATLTTTVRCLSAESELSTGTLLHLTELQPGDTVHVGLEVAATAEARLEDSSDLLVEGSAAVKIKNTYTLGFDRRLRLG